jgi:hypothetical protein
VFEECELLGEFVKGIDILGDFMSMLFSEQATL